MNRTQHPTNNDVLGAPPGTPIDQCGALPITRIVYPDGTPCVVSFWRPTPAELARLNAGSPVALFVLGSTHAPVAMLVDGEPGGLF
jgi:hypothetical protein